MRLDPTGLEGHLADVAELLERYGIVLDLAADEDLALEQTPGAALAFELRGFLPDGRQPPDSIVEIREIWRRMDEGGYERAEYEYELLDHERGFRRAWHLHDADYFVDQFKVVVHEHCERPVGSANCDHYAGPPIRDAFSAVERLVGTWVDGQVPDCAGLTCLEDG